MLYIVEGLGDPLFDQGFGGEDYLVVLQLDFQVVARLKSEAVVNFLWNDYLAAGTNLNDR